MFMKRMVPVLSIFCMGATAAFAADKTLQLEQYLDWETVGSPQIAPDGSTVIYQRNSVNKIEDRFDSSLWIMNADGTRSRNLTKGGGAQWSPDGTRIAFTKEADGGTQIFVRWMDAEGAVSQVTTGNLGPSLLQWSPDGKWIAFRANIPHKSDWQIKLPRPEGAKWTEDATIIDTLHYRQDRVGDKAGYDHLFVVPAEGGTPRQLTKGEWDVGARFAGIIDGQSEFRWTPDGSAVIFDGNYSPNEEGRPYTSHIYSVDVASGEITQLTREDGFWAGPSVSPNGKLIAYSGAKRSKSTFPQVEMRVVGIDGSDERVVTTDLANSPGIFAWSPNNRGVYFTMSKEGAANIHYADLNGNMRQVTTGQHQLNAPSVSNNGVVAATLSSPAITGDVARFALRDGDDFARLTNVNGDILSDVTLGRVEEVWYDSSDSTRAQGWIVYPPDFDDSQKYPLVLSIHGGPHGMYGVNFQFRFQEFASKGYVVLYTNPRGSTGYGSEFANAIDNQYPGQPDFDDLMAGVDTVVARGFIDEDRMYATGCSGGGVLTTWVVGNTDRFAAAAALCPVINWISFAGTADIVEWGYRRFHEDFWTNPMLWLEHSPLWRAPHIKTPTLFMTGDLDLRTPLAQAEEMYTALRKFDVPTKLIVIKQEWHGTTSKPSNMLRTQLYLQKWFDEHGGGTQVAGGAGGEKEPASP